jgi:hypothetical protein
LQQLQELQPQYHRKYHQEQQHQQLQGPQPHNHQQLLHYQPQQIQWPQPHHHQYLQLQQHHQLQQQRQKLHHLPPCGVGFVGPSLVEAIHPFTTHHSPFVRFDEPVLQQHAQATCIQDHECEDSAFGDARLDQTAVCDPIQEPRQSVNLVSSLVTDVELNKTAAETKVTNFIPQASNSQAAIKSVTSSYCSVKDLLVSPHTNQEYRDRVYRSFSEEDRDVERSLAEISRQIEDPASAFPELGCAQPGRNDCTSSLSETWAGVFGCDGRFEVLSPTLIKIRSRRSQEASAHLKKMLFLNR